MLSIGQIVRLNPRFLADFAGYVPDGTGIVIDAVSTSPTGMVPGGALYSVQFGSGKPGIYNPTQLVAV